MHGQMELPMMGVKYDAGKPRFDLIPTEPMRQIADVFAYGAEKYADRNWECGMAYGRVYAAMQRHLHAYWGGEFFDKESEMPHLAHAAFGILALLEFEHTHPEMDDRHGSQA